MLKEIEERITALKSAEFSTKQMKKQRFDFEFLKTIHRFLFEEIYDWAGQIRTVRMEKAGFVFAFPENIQTEAERIFMELANESYLQNYDKTKMIKRMAYFMSEINVIHAFREGNGRVNRFFFRKLAERNGYDLTFAKISKERYLQAIIKAAQDLDYTLLEEVLSVSIKGSD